MIARSASSADDALRFQLSCPSTATFRLGASGPAPKPVPHPLSHSRPLFPILALLRAPNSCPRLADSRLTEGELVAKKPEIQIYDTPRDRTGNAMAIGRGEEVSIRPGDDHHSVASGGGDEEASALDCGDYFPVITSTPQLHACRRNTFSREGAGADGQRHFTGGDGGRATYIGRWGLRACFGA